MRAARRTNRVEYPPELAEYGQPKIILPVPEGFDADPFDGHLLPRQFNTPPPGFLALSWPCSLRPAGNPRLCGGTFLAPPPSLNGFFLRCSPSALGSLDIGKLRVQTGATSVRGTTKCLSQKGNAANAGRKNAAREHKGIAKKRDNRPQFQRPGCLRKYFERAHFRSDSVSFARPAALDLNSIWP